jgi:hypothetical protein
MELKFYRKLNRDMKKSFIIPEKYKPIIEAEEGSVYE